MSIAAL